MRHLSLRRPCNRQPDPDRIPLRCFVCGQRNPFGLHLVFRIENDSIVADFQPREEHQGFPGVIHGGIVASVLDETMGRAAMLGSHPEWTMTGRLEIRYRSYVPYGPLLRVRATLGTERRRMHAEMIENEYPEMSKYLGRR
jgi:acyl-coenzyme A thioesterase PaaI-like protein